jgi:hypothetical protein
MLDWKYKKGGEAIVEKAFKPEQTVNKLCEAEVLLNQGALEEKPAGSWASPSRLITAGVESAVA